MVGERIKEILGGWRKPTAGASTYDMDDSEIERQMTVLNTAFGQKVAIDAFLRKVEDDIENEITLEIIKLKHPNIYYEIFHEVSRRIDRTGAWTFKMNGLTQQLKMKAYSNAKNSLKELCQIANEATEHWD